MHDCDEWLSGAPGMVRSAVSERGTVVEQEELAEGTYRLRVACPQLARGIVPGQFFMLRAPGRNDPLLGRPFALYDTYGDAAHPEGIDFGYHVVGKLTGLMADWRPGQPVEIWGPLGNGFPQVAAKRLVCVGGGIGYTPFLAVAREALQDRRYGRSNAGSSTGQPAATLLYGVRSRKHRANLAEFERLRGLSIRIATDDGSEGHHGFVTDLLLEELQTSAAKTAGGLTSDETMPDVAVYCCGPVPMMHAVARICDARDIPCWLSLETPMACGFGACFSCVTRVRVAEEPGWDYRRTCVEGPVFRARDLVLETVTTPAARCG
jgi:dihydroorotate dehydrogenase electron transfer subunit